jgi:hypothetical protein
MLGTYRYSFATHIGGALGFGRHHRHRYFSGMHWRADRGVGCGGFTAPELFQLLATFALVQ